MRTVLLETTAIISDPYTPRLAEPLTTNPGETLEIMVSTPDYDGTKAVLLPGATRPIPPRPDYWRNMTHEERMKDFREWRNSLPTGVGLSDYAVSRESIYKGVGE
jgi:hypothetical protein